MITDPPFTAHVIEHLIILVLTSIPTFSSKPHVPLRINMLHIPTPVVTGDSVLLSCSYDVGDETLYAVKWYKNMGEFFRFVPKSNPAFK
ncbi:hypothetical protein X975_06386, partial [Stegodyphus mimosarum]